jgi:hypothetical protein
MSSHNTEPAPGSHRDVTAAGVSDPRTAPPPVGGTGTGHATGAERAISDIERGTGMGGHGLGSYKVGRVVVRSSSLSLTLHR